MKIHVHARAGEVEFVRILLDASVDVNIRESEKANSRLLCSAVLSGSAELVRLLLDRGAEVNFAIPELPLDSYSLPRAITDGRLDLLQMLVEAGAMLNVIGPAGHTPLSWAVAYRHTEIAEYLRSKGALLHETPGWTPPLPAPPLDPIVEAMWKLGLQVSDQPIAVQGNVAVYIGNGPNDPADTVLFTKGMSDRALNVPPGGEAYQYAELVLYLDDWDTEVNKWQTPEHLWVINWMRRIAQIPFKNNTWLGGKWAIISNEEPPVPLSEYTPMTCWLLLGEKEPLARATLPDGKSVCFYTMMPIHTAERDLALREGLVALLQRFEEQYVSVELNPNRPSVV